MDYMKSIFHAIVKKLPLMAAILGVSLAMANVGHHRTTRMDPKTSKVDVLWQLKAGHSVSTNPSDYEPGTESCSGEVHFCGFYAPENGSSNEPQIPTGSNLATDLSAIASNPNSTSNTSSDVVFRDML